LFELATGSWQLGANSTLRHILPKYVELATGIGHLCDKSTLLHILKKYFEFATGSICVPIRYFSLIKRICLNWQLAAGTWVPNRLYILTKYVELAAV
jgi:hypothetical protein